MKNLFIYKKHLSFPIRLIGGLTITFSVFFLYKKGISIHPFLFVLIGFLLLIFKKGFIVDSLNLHIIKIISFGFILPYSKYILKA